MQPNDAGRELDPDHQDSTAYDRLEGDTEAISAAVQTRRCAIARAFGKAEKQDRREFRARADLPSAFIASRGERISLAAAPGERIETDHATNLGDWR